MKNSNYDLLFLNLTNYLNIKQITILKHLINKNSLSALEYIDTSRLKSSRTMLNISYGLGVLGVDRFILKDIKLGIFKLFISIIFPALLIISYFNNHDVFNSINHHGSDNFFIAFFYNEEGISLFLCVCIFTFWLYDAISVIKRTQEYNFKTILNMFFQDKNIFSNQSTSQKFDNEYENNDQRRILNSKIKNYFKTEDIAIIKWLKIDISDFNINLLKNPLEIFFTSLFLGVFGIDRFLLKNQGLGKTKLITLILTVILSITSYFVLGVVEIHDIGLGIITAIIAFAICVSCYGVLVMLWLLDLCTVMDRTQYYNFIIACDIMCREDDKNYYTITQPNKSGSRHESENKQDIINSNNE